MESKVSRLAALIEAKVAKSVPAEKPRLAVVGGKDAKKLVLRGEDACPRERTLFRIRDLAVMYSLAWLVRQETAHYGKALEALNDDELTEVLERVERGHECRIEGIPFDDAGLVRHTVGEPADY